MDYNVEKDDGKIPLQYVDIQGNIIGTFSYVTIVQKYKNLTGINAEFIYTFPMPDSAFICGFEAKIGENTIVAQIKEKEKAKKEYDEAVVKGNTGMLLESHRPNIFQMSLGQVDVDEEIEIKITYGEELKVVDGEMRVSVPTLVAPRYIPGKDIGVKTGSGVKNPTDKVPDADFITPPIGNVSYKASIKFTIDAGRKIDSIKSASHEIVVDKKSDTISEVSLKESTLLNRDFILNISLFGENISFCTYGKNSANENFAYISFTPELPAILNKGGIEYIFLVDVSGSMSGRKLDEAKNAINICLRNLTEDDNFNIVAFESSLHIFSNNSLQFNEKSLKQATKWVKSLNEMGGTEILPAIEFALSQKNNMEKVVMLFTDGEVGNEEEIIKYIKQNGNNIRFYSMGIDTAVNSYFINEIAKAGNGASEFVYPGENVDDKIIRHFSRINSGYIEKIEIVFNKEIETDIAGGIPKRIYDLESTSFVMKLEEAFDKLVKINGINEGQKIEILIDDLKEAEKVDILEKLWAKNKMKQLEEYEKSNNRKFSEAVKEEIVKLSEKYGIISPYTSFIAIYKRKDKLTGIPNTQVVPVSSPHMWEIEKELNQVCCAAPPLACMAVPSKKRLSKKMESEVFNDFFCDNSISFDEEETARIAPSEELKKSKSKGGLNFFGKIFRKKEVKEEIMEEEVVIEKKSAKILGEIVDLKHIALSQNFDGSFGDTTQNIVERIKDTLKCIVNFATSKEDILPFKNQLNKALVFIGKNKAEIITSKKYFDVLYIVISLCMERKIIRGTKHEALNLLDDIKSIELENLNTYNEILKRDIGEIKKYLEEKIK